MSISASQVEPRKQLEKLKSGRRRRREGGVGGAEWGMGGGGGVIMDGFDRCNLHSAAVYNSPATHS